jgi:hypothetical protein
MGRTGNVVSSNMSVPAEFRGTHGHLEVHENATTRTNGQHVNPEPYLTGAKVIRDAPAAAPAPAPASAATVPATDNLAIAFNFFRGKGLGATTCCAIIGNLQQESSPTINPSLAQAGGGPGRGIAQWEIPPHGSRFTALENFARQRGTAWTNLNTQLEFMWHEMTQRDICDRMRGRATTWNDNGAFANNLNRKGARPLPNGFQDFRAMTDLEQAVRIFDATYHRSGTPMMDRRITFARQAFARFAPNTSTPTPVTPPTPAPAPVAIRAGDQVRIQAGATYFNGGNIPTWVTNQNWFVASINGERVVIGQNVARTNQINSPVNIRFLTRV